MITQVLGLRVAICEGTPGSCQFACSLAESQEKTADLNRRPAPGATLSLEAACWPPVRPRNVSDHKSTQAEGVLCLLMAHFSP